MKIAVIIPAYQEEKTISSLLVQVLKYVKPVDVIVVDDGSTDSTSSEASRHLIHLIRHHWNFGKGASLRTGIHFAIENEYDAVLALDGDLQHDPGSIPRFIDSFEKMPVDLIIGKRTRNLSVMPFLRVLSNTITSWLISWRTGITIPDSQCGYRLIATRFFRENSFQCNRFDFETEVVLKAALGNYRIRFLDIPTIYDQENSKIKGIRDTFRFIKLYLKSFGWTHGF